MKRWSRVSRTPHWRLHPALRTLPAPTQGHKLQAPLSEQIPIAHQKTTLEEASKFANSNNWARGGKTSGQAATTKGKLKARVCQFQHIFFGRFSTIRVGTIVLLRFSVLVRFTLYHHIFVIIFTTIFSSSSDSDHMTSHA